MQRVTLILCGLCLTSLTLVAREEKKSDLEQMQGTWDIEKQVYGGENIPQEELKKNKPQLKIAKSTFEIYLAGKLLDKGTFKLDPKQSPKAIDTTSTYGTNKGMEMKGIYELKGDSLRVSFAQPGKDRPKELKSQKETLQIYIEYKRTR